VTNAILQGNTHPLVSIGMPTYNRPDSLKTALAGIVAQTYHNLEIIVSDNASPEDDTEEIVREFMRIDSRIQYYKQPENLGAAFNFQFVLDKATGDYFMWAADDDWRDPAYVETLVGLMESSPDAALGFSDYSALDEKGAQLTSYPDFYPYLLPFTTRNKLLRLWRYFMQYETLGKANIIYGLMRRENLKGFNWDVFSAEHGSTNFGVDMLFVYKMLSNGRLVLSDRKLYACTVGNVKEYDTENRSNPFSKQVKFLVNVFNYTLRYVALSGFTTKSLLILTLHVKFVKTIIMLRRQIIALACSALKVGVSQKQQSP
jgi:glycosyltransferase involved in cell wall biosynthesis